MSGPLGSSQWMYNAGGDYYEYKIPYSCRFDGGASLTRNLDAPTDQDKFTLSVWLKRGNLTTASEGKHAFFGITSTNNPIGFFALEENGFSYVDYGQGHSNYIVRARTDSIFRDPSAWYHVVYRIDQAQGTQSNRFRVYVNGVEQAHNTGVMGGSYLDMTQSYLASLNSDSYTSIIGGGGNYDKFDGYMAEMHFIDGQSLAPTSFAEAGDYGDWKPIEVESMTYGNNGFYLDFADSGALGDDESGNTNDYSVSNLSAHDQMLDSPTNNFCTLSSNNRSYVNCTLAEGNLQAEGTSNSAAGNAYGTQSHLKGYFEWLPPTDKQMARAGLKDVDDIVSAEYAGTGNNHTSGGDAYVQHSYDGAVKKREGGSNSTVATYTALAVDEIGMCAFDIPNGKIWFGRQGTWENSGDPAAGTNAPITTVTTTKTFVPIFNGDDGGDGTFNFGQDSSFAGNKTAQGNQDSNDIGDFYYTPPSGFLALCTANLPAVDVTPSEAFNTVLYDGNGTDGASGQTVTGVGFTPDLTWLKNREDSGPGHILTDAVRGAGESLHPNNDAVENTDSAAGHLSSWNSDGFVLYGGTRVNQSGEAHVAYNWKGGNATSGTGDFTQGSIASTCSRNVDAGFSIVSYSGTGSAATVGHGLSKAPEMIIAKNREFAETWGVYHAGNTDAPETDYLGLNNNSATSDYASAWNDTAPTATLFSLGSWDAVNRSGDDHIAYCFHSVDGYSKFGSYEGNNNVDGAMIFTGFRPQFVILKGIDAVVSWHMFDTKREAYNVMNNYLYKHTHICEV